MTQGIYCYIDKKTNEVVYVGKDSHINKKSRYNSHKSPSHYGKQSFNRILQNNFNRYKYIVLEEGNISQNILNALEMCFIQKYNPKFNFTNGGEGTLGFKHSKKTRKRMSENNKGRNNHMFGKHHSEKTRKKISEKSKGKNNHMFGKHHSKEAKEKMSKAHKGRAFLEEHKKKISKARNTSGYYRVHKSRRKDIKQGFIWRYRWYNKDKKREQLSSVNIKKLEEKVKEKGLPWFKIGKEGLNERI